MIAAWSRLDSTTRLGLGMLIFAAVVIALAVYIRCSGPPQPQRMAVVEYGSSWTILRDTQTGVYYLSTSKGLARLDPSTCESTTPISSTRP